jgi:hypothetical protein
LLFGATANIAANLPSGFRFVIIANLIFLSIMLMIYGSDKLQIRFKNAKLVFSTIFLFIAIIWARLGMEFYGVDFFVGNPITVLFSDKTEPVIITLKKFLGI